jgi:hypothetical protein
MEKVFSKLEGDLSGNFYRHSEMTQAQTQQLIDDHFLFRGKDRMQAASGYHVSKPMDLIRFGKRICTLPRRPEPKLLGQHEIMPSAGSLRNTGPGPFIALILSSMALNTRTSLTELIYLI